MLKDVGLLDRFIGVQMPLNLTECVPATKPLTTAQRALLPAEFRGAPNSTVMLAMLTKVIVAGKHEGGRPRDLLRSMF